MGRRFAFLFVIVVVLIIIAVAIFNHAQGNWSGPPDNDRERWEGGFFWPPFALLAIGVGVFLLVRKIGRTFTPLANVIDAADRVAEGDYSVRVPMHGPPELRGVVEAFNTMATRLEANETQRKHLLSDIAHELRTPLSVVQGTIEGMLDEVYPMDAPHLAPLMDQTRLITRLLNDLQTVATAEAGVLDLHLSDTELGDLVRDVVTSFTPVANRNGVSMAAHIRSEITLTVDPVRIRQVLDNLATNALRYTDPGGTVTMTMTSVPGNAEIVVRDTGRGMPAEEAERMFERFVKSADSGGSGLGLAIAKGLVEAHRGRISAESEPGVGTTITIRLPTV